jgi:hypothetical protein
MDYLALATTVQTMTSGEVVEHFEEAGIHVGDFHDLLDVNSALGGLQLPRPGDRSRKIVETIGVPTHYRPTSPTELFVPFFDFGVAAPCTVGISRSGSVVADFGNDLSPIEVADSFEVFVEGQALEYRAQSIDTQPARVDLDVDRNEAPHWLPAGDRVEEASDRWTTWWHSPTYMARLSRMWDGLRSPRLTVWAAEDAPNKFSDLVD